VNNESLRNEVPLRLKRVQERLRKHGLDGAIFVQKTDLFYLSATDQTAHLWVPSEGSALLMVRRSVIRARQDAAIQDIVPLPGFSALPQLIQRHDGRLPLRMGLEMDVLPVNQYRIYKGLFPGAKMVDISAVIRRIRMIKSSYEISCMTRAAAMGDRMFQKVPSVLDFAETETDLARHLESYYRSLGHPGVVRARAFNMECFYGHVLAGPSGAVPSASPGPTSGSGLGPFYSQGAGRGKIRPHEPILVDYTSSVEGYVSDQARLFSIGKLPGKFLDAHDVMIEAQETIKENARPGMTAGELYDKALEVVRKHELEKGFMGYPDPVPFVAHGIGLELDEWPIIGRNRKTILEEGMVFALEPKFIFPEEGVVGLENVFVVTSEGLMKLNRFPDGVYVC
jgi:Xaa-Pro aminopeptidase